MDSQKFIIKNKFVKITPFTKKNITNTFIRSMNRPEINKYLVTKRFTKQNCLEYYLDKKKRNDFYYCIYNNLSKRYIGTITLHFKNNDAFVGNVIYVKKEHGSRASKFSFNIFLDFIFKKTDLKKIYAGTNPHNHSSNFNLLINNFKIIKKTTKEFRYILNKKDCKKFATYQIIKNVIF
tara:strand:+ start:3054 stop:3590 length:537 start_codon:yes stop_codon:yes gene_type:complete